MANEQKQQLLNEEQLSKLVGISIATLQSWRHRGEGPPFYKLNRLVRYDYQKVIEYFESCEVTSFRNTKIKGAQ